MNKEPLPQDLPYDLIENEDGALFTADKKKSILYPCAKEGDTYRIDDAEAVIGAGCFVEQAHLQNVYIGKDVLLRIVKKLRGITTQLFILF